MQQDMILIIDLGSEGNAVLARDGSLTVKMQ